MILFQNLALLDLFVPPVGFSVSDVLLSHLFSLIPACISVKNWAMILFPRFDTYLYTCTHYQTCETTSNDMMINTINEICYTTTFFYLS
jgi:hypothetical protein